MHQFDELDDEWRYVTAENREAPLSRAWRVALKPTAGRYTGQSRPKKPAPL